MLNWPCACSCIHAHVHTHTLAHLPSTKQSPCTSHFIPITAPRSSCHKRSCSCRGQQRLSKCLLLPNLPDVCSHPFLTHSLSYLLSHFPSPSLFPSFRSLTPSPALLSDLSFFPLSSVCTMHINYSEAVYWSLRLIQSELDSALMGSRCTCCRLQRTLEEAAEEERGHEGEIKTAGRDKQECR